MMYRLFSALGVLFGMASADGSYGLGPKPKRICPGMPFSFTLTYKISGADLMFYKNGVERKVATTKEIIDPQFRLNGTVPYLPEVMKTHEGKYYWKAPSVDFELNYIRLILKDCSVRQNVVYGEELALNVPADASVLEFTPHLSDQHSVLWRRIHRGGDEEARGAVKDGRWTAQRMTQADQGRYTLLRESGGQISSTVVSVEELQIHAHVADDDVRDHWRTDVNISAREAVVTYFTAFGGEHVLFRDGMETDEGFDIFGNRITLQKSTLQKSTFSISKAQPSDAGRYEIHDKNGHLAISLYLERDPEFDLKSLATPLGISAGVLAGLLCCCWCCCKCCSDDDGDKTESAAASPDTEQLAHVHDPSEMSGPGDPLQPPSSAPSSGDTNELTASMAYPPNPWENSPPPYFPDPASRPHSIVVPVEPSVPEWVPSVPECVPSVPEWVPSVPECVPSPYSSAAPTAPPEAPDGGGGGDRGAPTAPSAPPDPGLRYQSRAWGSGQDDFLSSSPLCMDSATDSCTFTSNNLNF
ncbi:uncharacterized protein LOC105888946 [Clupea harengus]|uniref:Uncharacterized protein LOC105888946 n=1 Tax=Clupea harengus TaxID=7950 RepID=A0A6P8F7X9_CLUHA|nr:uncharacterized protein LOC105888946 [Clupea harengus]XP_031424643.1 uncharacterized protein LOC105888946 [Clupea harengus]XP_042563924.1 uncharacterized protein LOC105888946 [Clupea harengus]XP_042563925.1 uncharacterized protein LOC105888946 [Clupea harengus]